MRNLFINYVTQQAAIDPSLFLIVGDVGFSVVEPFKERYPDRFINAGIAEQNMIGIAAGLAMASKNVYVYSIIPFVTMRCFEQIRNDLCYQNLPVKLVGIGSGFSYGHLGVTHYALEDVALMRVLPNMTIVAPGCKHELSQLMPALNTLQGPAYIRLGNNEELIPYAESCSVKLCEAIEIVPHDAACIIASGNALDLAFQVHQTLKELGVFIGLVSMPTIKPLDISFLVSRPWQAIFTIEEHMINGGLGENIARVISEQLQHKVIFHAFGINDCYFHEIGSRAYLKEQAGLASSTIAHKIMPLVGTNNNKKSVSFPGTL